MGSSKKRNGWKTCSLQRLYHNLSARTHSTSPFFHFIHQTGFHGQFFGCGILRQCIQKFVQVVFLIDCRRSYLRLLTVRCLPLRRILASVAVAATVRWGQRIKSRGLDLHLTGALIFERDGYHASRTGYGTVTETNGPTRIQCGGGTPST